MNLLPPFRRAAALAALALLPAFCASAETLSAEVVGKGAVTGLSGDGKVATGTMNGSYETFRWVSGAGLTKLGRATLPVTGVFSGNPAISRDGKVVVATVLSDDGTYGTAGRWTQATGWQTPAALPPGGGQMDYETSSAWGLSGDGNVVSGLFWRPGMSDGSAHAMRWTLAGGMVDLGSERWSSRADGVNADGSVIAGWDEHPTYGNRRAAVWVNGVKTILDASDWPSEGTAVNSAGTIIVGSGADPARQTQVQAMMWKWNGSGWTPIPLGVMNGRGTDGIAYASGVSDDGSFAVGVARKDVMSPKSVGWVWTPSSGMVELTEYMKANGMPPSKLYKPYNVTALSADGKTFAIAEQLVVAPWTIRSRVIHRAP